LTLVYFAPVPWASYAQRPHYFVREWFAHAGGSVVWVDPYPTRFPAAGDLRRFSAPDRVTPPAVAGLMVMRPRGLPVEPIAGGRWLNRRAIFRPWLERLHSRIGGERIVLGIGRPSDLALAALETLSPEASVFDAMDDFPEFYTGRAKRWTAACERRISESVSMVLASSTALLKKFEASAIPCRLVRNAFAMDNLPAVAPPAAATPVLGYVGAVARWFDWPLVHDIARARPDAQVRIIGPVFVPSPNPLPANVSLLPACSEADAIAQMRVFWAGLIPFVRSPLTASVDPVKYYGYRGLGLPVLTTRFGEMADRIGEPGVFQIEHGSALDGALDAAFSAPRDPVAVRQFRAAHSWSQRFAESRVFEALRGTRAAAEPRQ
jgi:hypothetical protein